MLYYISKLMVFSRVKAIFLLNMILIVVKINDINLFCLYIEHLNIYLNIMYIKIFDTNLFN